MKVTNNSRRAGWQKIFLFLTLILVGTSLSKAELAPTYSVVVPGLDYGTLRETNHPWSIHIARLDRTHVDLDITTTLAQGKIVGLNSVANQAKTLPAKVGKPLAAVNGDFFVIAKGPYQGDPGGLQVLQGEMVSSPNGPSFWAEPKGKLHLENVTPKFKATLAGGEAVSFGLNQERKPGSAVAKVHEPKPSEVVLYTPTFGPSTRTTNGLELVLERVEGKPWLPLHADKKYSARVREIRAGGDTALVPGIAVLSIDPGVTNKFAKAQPGTIIGLSTDTSKDVSQANTAIGGGPILVTHGKEQQWLADKGTNVVRHPRTAMGWSDRYFYLVVVDGRQKGLSMGMSFTELAHFMKSLGCTEAMNLDGGGSSTFWLNGKIMNSPSDKHERSVANALVIVQHEPNGQKAAQVQKTAN
ncbi:MAG: hypothetical protein JWQ71_4660 [Pedosphaera sp.]|nr:hypothetical protein [Pedosphaera sp.]